MANFENISIEKGMYQTKGELYHVSFFQLQEPVEHVYLFITKTRGVLYLNDKEYKMLGDTKPLLDFLENVN